jgi:hypothetical protein
MGFIKITHLNNNLKGRSIQNDRHKTDKDYLGIFGSAGVRLFLEAHTNGMFSVKSD